MCTDGSIEIMHQPGTHLFSTSNQNITSFGKLEQQTWESVSVNTSVITIERNGYVHRLDPANGAVGRYLVHPNGKLVKLERRRAFGELYWVMSLAPSTLAEADELARKAKTDPDNFQANSATVREHFERRERAQAVNAVWDNERKASAAATKAQNKANEMRKLVQSTREKMPKNAGGRTS